MSSESRRFARRLQLDSRRVRVGDDARSIGRVAGAPPALLLLRMVRRAFKRRRVVVVVDDKVGGDGEDGIAAAAAAPPPPLATTDGARRGGADAEIALVRRATTHRCALVVLLCACLREEVQAKYLLIIPRFFFSYSGKITQIHLYLCFGVRHIFLGQQKFRLYCNKLQ